MNEPIPRIEMPDLVDFGESFSPEPLALHDDMGREPPEATEAEVARPGLAPQLRIAAGVQDAEHQILFRGPHRCSVTQDSDRRLLEVGMAVDRSTIGLVREEIADLVPRREAALESEEVEQFVGQHRGRVLSVMTAEGTDVRVVADGDDCSSERRGLSAGPVKRLVLDARTVSSVAERATRTGTQAFWMREP